MRRFVLLEHDHPFLHWDLLLEDGESLRSWRLLSFPVPHRPIGAEPLPPHRRMYLDYEGPVSGDRGTVSRVDSGTCEIVVDTPGHQQFRLRGEKCQGTISVRPDEAASTGWTAQFSADAGSSTTSSSAPSDS